jgi:hypothetical protein
VLPVQVAAKSQASDRATISQLEHLGCPFQDLSDFVFTGPGRRQVRYGCSLKRLGQAISSSECIDCFAHRPLGKPWRLSARPPLFRPLRVGALCEKLDKYVDRNAAKGTPITNPYGYFLRMVQNKAQEKHQAPIDPHAITSPNQWVRGKAFAKVMGTPPIIETLTEDNVTYVRFGLLKPSDQQQPAVVEFAQRSRNSSARSRASAIGLGTLDEERRSHVRDPSANLSDLTRPKARHKRCRLVQRVQA